MRYPTSGAGIDVKATEDLLIQAVEYGINYFDTAYFYSAGKSETILGNTLKKHNLRDKVKIATKLPPFFVRKASDIEKIFSIQLDRLKTGYIDYYLMHMLTDTASFDRLRSFGIEQWIADKKAAGIIRNVGFSYHGGKNDFIKIIDSYDWDICQIQYNYYDENNQAGKSGLEYASSKGIPVIIMEPLRGGKLVFNTSPEIKELFAGADPGRSLADWALSWVWNHPEPTVVLSGMSSIEQLSENVHTASNSSPGFLSPKELELFNMVKLAMRDKIKVDCTGCAYCMPCPSGVDIPVCFSYYNDMNINGKSSAMRGYLQNTAATSRNPRGASACTQCGYCEPRCPQVIPIRENLQKVKKAFEPAILKPVLAVARRFFGT
jgi:predicted aldo/keto reductase-like oxidoreductase